MKRRLTARDLIEIWALRSTGGSLKDPCKPSTGGRSSIDGDQIVVDYVESTTGFEIVEPCLDRLRHYKDARGLWYRFYGLSLLGSALRRRWGQWFFMTEDKKEVPELVLGSFRVELQKRIVESPPVFPAAPEDLCPKEQEEAMIAEIESRASDVRTW